MKYNREYWDVVWSRPYGRYNTHHREIWDVVFPFLKGRVADLGCGPCMIYKNTNVDLTGVDISQQALIEAKKNYPQGTYVLADACDTNLPSDEFDTVVMFGLLDYFEDWSILLKEAERIGKPSGHILATLLDGWEGHDWKKYKHLTSHWYLYEIK